MSNFIDSIYVLKSKYNSKKGKNDTIYFVPNHKKYKGSDLVTLKKVYKNPGILNSISSNDVVIPIPISSLTINELKHIVGDYLKLPAEDILLFCERSYSYTP